MTKSLGCRVQGLVQGLGVRGLGVLGFRGLRV